MKGEGERVKGEVGGVEMAGVIRHNLEVLGYGE